MFLVAAKFLPLPAIQEILKSNRPAIKSGFFGGKNELKRLHCDKGIAYNGRMNQDPAQGASLKVGVPFDAVPTPPTAEEVQSQLEAQRQGLHEQALMASEAYLETARKENEGDRNGVEISLNSRANEHSVTVYEIRKGNDVVYLPGAQVEEIGEHHTASYEVIVAPGGEVFPINTRSGYRHVDVVSNETASGKRAELLLGIAGDAKMTEYRIHGGRPGTVPVDGEAVVLGDSQRVDIRTCRLGSGSAIEAYNAAIASMGELRSMWMTVAGQG